MSGMQSNMESGISGRNGSFSQGPGYHLPGAPVAALPTLDDIRTSLGEVRTLLESADHVIA